MHSENLIEESDNDFDIKGYKAKKAEFEIQYQINQKGIQYEKKGEIDKAIEQYELVISKNFEGNYPYDRLAIIYRKRKQIDDEIRVLEKAIFVFSNVVSQHLGDRKPKLEKFKERLEKINKLKN